MSVSLSVVGCGGCSMIGVSSEALVGSGINLCE